MTFLTIAGMALITFGLRFIPLLPRRSVIPRDGRLKIMLDQMPLAVLSALTIPGIFQVDPNNRLIGIAAGGAAVILVLIPRMPLLLVVLGSITTAVIVKLLGMSI